MLVDSTYLVGYPIDPKINGSHCAYSATIRKTHCFVSVVMISTFITSLTATKVRHEYRRMYFSFSIATWLRERAAVLTVFGHCLPGLYLAMETLLPLIICPAHTR